MKNPGNTMVLNGGLTSMDQKEPTMRTKVVFWALTGGVLTVALVLVACGNLLARVTVAETGADIQVSAAEISGAELLLTAAHRVVSQYSILPVCDGRTVVCSQPAVKSRLKDDAKLAQEKLTLLRSVPEIIRPTIYRDFKAAVQQLIADTPNVTTRTGVAGGAARVERTDDAGRATTIGFQRGEP